MSKVVILVKIVNSRENSILKSYHQIQHTFVRVPFDKIYQTKTRHNDEIKEKHQRRINIVKVNNFVLFQIKRSIVYRAGNL